MPPAKRGRYAFGDRVLVRLAYRDGLRASEAVNMRWSQVDLDVGVLHVARVRGSIDSAHSLDATSCAICVSCARRLGGSMCSRLSAAGRCQWMLCNTSLGRPAEWPALLHNGYDGITSRKHRQHATADSSLVIG
jgi:integrase-like protein